MYPLLDLASLYVILLEVPEGFNLLSLPAVDRDLRGLQQTKKQPGGP